MHSLIEDRRLRIDDLRRKYHVKRLELFGSAATGAFDQDESDVDFLVAFSPPGDFAAGDQYLGLLKGLEELFERKVDLVDISAARNPYFIADALRHRVRLYAA